MITAKPGLRPEQSFLSPAEYTLELCSSACVFANLPEGFQVVRHGHQADYPAVASDSRLWLNISSEVHPPGHPLHLPELAITRNERSALLKRLSQAAPAQVVRVYDVCDCGMTIERIDGWPLADINSWPMWLRQIDAQSVETRLSAVSWREFIEVLSDLAEGLHSLHDLGIAHGDPFPINALVVKQRGVWVDVNGIVNASPLSQALDIWAYLSYTVMTRLLKIKSWAPAVIRHVWEIAAESELHDILPRISHLLRQAAEAPAATEISREGTILAAIAEMYGTCNIQLRTDELGHVARTLTPIGLVNFYSAFEWNARIAAERERYLAAEQARHMLVERELQRTLMARYETQIDELKGWNAQMEHSKGWLEEQRDNWQKKAEERERIIQEQIKWIADLEKAKNWLDEQRSNWQGIAEDYERTVQDQLKRIADLEKAKNWLDEQRSNWQRIAEDHERTVQDQLRRIADLEEGKNWLEEQCSNWQKIAEEHEQVIQEQRKWIVDLEKAKNWLDEQRSNWQRIAEDHERTIQDQLRRIADPEEGKTS